MAKRKISRQPSGFRVSPSHKSQERLLQESKVYLMHNLPYFMVNKFGISDKVNARRKSVSDTTPGYVFFFFAPTLPYAWQLEQLIHFVYRFQNIAFWTGSGRTEWFLVFSPVFGTLVMYVSIEHLHVLLPWKYYALAYFTPFVWWDGYLWLLVFSGLKILAAILFLAGLCWAVAHIG